MNVRPSSLVLALLAIPAANGCGTPPSAPVAPEAAPSTNNAPTPKPAPAFSSDASLRRPTRPSPEGSSRPSSLPSPSASGAPAAAAPTANPCVDGAIPVAIGGVCTKTCMTTADCKKGEQCLPASWDMGGGMIAHDKACF